MPGHAPHHVDPPEAADEQHASHAGRPEGIERRCDVVVVGGSAAGLAAALQIVRQRWSVIVIDSGEPRNAPADHMHGYLGHEGVAPGELIAAGRDEVRSYGGEVLAARVAGVTRADDDRFRTELDGGHTIVSRRVLAATGLLDVLPDIEGLAERWGRDVIHCPFCHGFEVRERRIVQIVSHPAGLHTAALFRQLTGRLTLVLHSDVEVDDGGLDALRAGGIDVQPGPVRRIVTEDGHIVAVETAKDESIAADAVVVAPRFAARAEVFAPLGLEVSPHPSGLGTIVETDPTGATAVPGLFAAGNITDPSQQVLHAAADGSRVGAMISFSLAHEDLQAVTRSPGQQDDWDHRYSGRPLWSGNPNGSLVNQLDGVAPGRALDVGAGEGGDAFWLAEQGWQVTASDVSQRALDRIAQGAVRRGLAITGHLSDANAYHAFAADAFDVVSAQYASIPRTPDGRAVRNLIDAVAPGGTLLVVNHDPEAMREALDSGSHPQAFDRDAYVRTDDFAVALADEVDWEIETYATVPRPAGAVSASHHVDDVIFRARRHSSPIG